MLLRIVLLAGTGVALGCSDSVSPDTLVTGVWTYAGVEMTPTPATLSGSLEWKGVSGGAQAFEGTYTLVEQLSSGTNRTLSGSGAGQILHDSVADFDLTVDGADRQHIGILRGDSITGNWAVLGASQSSSGTFVLRRSK